LIIAICGVESATTFNASWREALLPAASVTCTSKARVAYLRWCAAEYSVFTKCHAGGQLATFDLQGARRAAKGGEDLAVVGAVVHAASSTGVAICGARVLCTPVIGCVATTSHTDCLITFASSGRELHFALGVGLEIKAYGERSCVVA
jgi:hypothetical protein